MKYFLFSIAIVALTALLNPLALTARASTIQFTDSAQLNMHGNLAAVNFYTASGGSTPGSNSPMTGPIQGVNFTNTDFVSSTGGVSNTPVTVGNLIYTLPETAATTGRFTDSAASITGTGADQAAAQQLAAGISYFAPGDSGSLAFSFGAGFANKLVDVQIIGGGDPGWTNQGTLNATVTLGTGPGGSLTEASNQVQLMEFLATTDGSGQLNIGLNVSSDSFFVGIAGVVVSTPTPEPSTLILGAVGLIGLGVVVRRRQKA